jgi:hypothetical protein
MVALAMGETHILTEAEARLFETRDRILALRNPELLAKEKAEFQQMTDAELEVIAQGPESNPRAVHPIDTRLDAQRESFKGVMRWAVVLGTQVARERRDHIPKADIERIVTAAWEAFDGMSGAELDTGWQYPDDRDGAEEAAAAAD